MPVARYSVSYGLAGCYMPDTVSGPLTFSTRRELAAFIRDELAAYDMPASLIREVRLRRLWGFVKQRGASVAHFSLEHRGYSLAFHGLTEGEAAAMEGGA